MNLPAIPYVSGDWGGRGLWLVPRPPTSAGTSCPPPGGHDNGVRSHTHISGIGGLFGHFGSTNSPGSPGPLLSLWDSEEQFSGTFVFSWLALGSVTFGLVGSVGYTYYGIGFRGIGHEKKSNVSAKAGRAGIRSRENSLQLVTTYRKMYMIATLL